MLATQPCNLLSSRPCSPWNPPDHAHRPGVTVQTNLRFAALMMLSPRPLACWRQDQLKGSSLRPLCLDAPSRNAQRGLCAGAWHLAGPPEFE